MHHQLNALSRDLHHCLRRDYWPLRKRLDRLRNQLKAGRDIEPTLLTLTEDCQRSKTRRHQRSENRPRLSYPDLPVVGKKADIAAAIQQHQVVIVCGETGSGKTTQLPKICLEIGRGCAGLIGHTQPRRIAARSVADRIADELGERIGQSVGFKIRFQDKTSTDAYIKLMTDGILLAEIQADPYLNQYDTLILDEAHERSLNIDFLLGYLKWLLPKRRDLKLIVTSATIDPERFAQHFGDAPIVMVSGRTYPVEVRYQPVGVENSAAENEGETKEATEADVQQAILDAVDELHRDQRGDILIFLSGERDIRETTEALRKHHPHHAEVLPLYAKLTAQQQQKVFQPKGQRRIILATNVAETSLTVPGIGAVIDAGYARISRYSHRSKLQRLPIEKISQASARQRAGRCGRIGPGICIRLYSEDDFNNRLEFTEPEILRTNLASVILQMKLLKLADISQFPFVEPPSPAMIKDGLKVLHELHALDSKGKLTRLGQKLARLPVDPRLGRMLLAAEQEACLTEVAIIVAGLSIQDPKERPLDQAQAADQRHARYKDPQSDFLGLMRLWRDFQEQKKHLTQNKLRKYCRCSFISYLRMREWEDIHHQLMQAIKGELAMKPNETSAEYGNIHRALLSGLLSNIGFKSDTSEYQGARNLKFQIFPGSALFKARPKWIMAAEQVETSKVYARIAAKIEPEWVEQYADHLVNRQHYQPHWEKKPARVAIYEKVTLHGITLSSQRKIPCERVDLPLARELFIRSALVEQEFDCQATFFHHNRDLLTSIERLQHKGRRVDLLVDDEHIFAFYAARLPDSVCNGITFHQWYKTAERAQPDCLKLTREDLLRKEDDSVSEDYFPDRIQANTLQIDLDYKFEPGDQADGVTTVVSLHQLNQLKPESFEWLVPGLLREKIIALIKALPKQYRKQFVPAPDYADRCLSHIEFGQGSLYQSLAEALRRINGVRVPTNVWADAVLPDHLQMNFQLQDKQGRLIEQSRHLTTLQQQYGSRARQVFQTLAADSLTRSGCTQWVFGELAEHYQDEAQGVSGYPALIDEGNAVGLKLLDTETKACRQHRAGLIRLFQLQLRKEVQYLRKQLSYSTADKLIYGRLPQHPYCPEHTDPKPDLIADTIQQVIATVFVDEQPAIRTQQAFEQRLADQKKQLMTTANEWVTLTKPVLQDAQILSKTVSTLPDRFAGTADLRAQLAALLHPGFIAWTTQATLKSLPRYLKAMAHRADKIRSDPAADARKLAELQPFWDRYWEARRQQPDAIDEAFRWALEEFRVSLFAQVVKTAYPISAKRLEKRWDSCLKS